MNYSQNVCDLEYGTDVEYEELEEFHWLGRDGVTYEASIALQCKIIRVTLDHFEQYFTTHQAADVAWCVFDALVAIEEINPELFSSFDSSAKAKAYVDTFKCFASDRINLYHRHKAVEKKDKLTAHWWFGESFSLLYANPRSTKPESMALAFAKTLRSYNNDLVQHRMEGDAPELDLQSLAIPHFVGTVLMANQRYLFQPGKPRELKPDEEAVHAET